MTHAQYISYFEELATINRDLHHSDATQSFFRINRDELLDALKGKNISFPCMLLESFEGGIDSSENFDNMLKRTTGAFWIMEKTKPNDFDGENATLERCLNLGHDIIARMLYDLKTRAIRSDGTIKIRDFHPWTVKWNKFGPTGDREIGYRFTFTIHDPEQINLGYDGTKWGLPPLPQVQTGQPIVYVPQGIPGPQGPPGPPGADGTGGGGSSSVEVVAGEAISKYDVVTGFGTRATSTNVNHRNRILGLAMANIANSAAGNVQVEGPITNALWSWTKGDVIFLNGSTLSIMAPSSGFIVQIGVASAADTIDIEVQPSILL